MRLVEKPQNICYKKLKRNRVRKNQQALLKAMIETIKKPTAAVTACKPSKTIGLHRNLIPNKTSENAVEFLQNLDISCSLQNGKR